MAQGNDEQAYLPNLDTEKSHTTLQTAKRFAEIDPRGAIHFAYHSMFYVAQRVLMLLGIIGIHKHKDVNNKFEELFMENNLIDKEIVQSLRQVEITRYEADYDLTKTFTSENAREIIDKAEVFITAVEKLNQNGLFPMPICKRTSEEHERIAAKRKNARKTLLRPIILKNADSEDGKLTKKALELFVDRMIEEEGDNLLRMTLFGSVARGDSTPDSDIDVCVIIKNGDSYRLLDRAIDISFDIDYKENGLRTSLSPFLRTQEEYESGLQERSAPVYENIEREGIVLYNAGNFIF